MPIDPMQVKSLFLAAVEKDHAQHAAFLDQACGPDAELRRRVEQLLSVHDDDAATS